jgi:nucleotide-binding universal stress UspA family protein
VSRPTLLIPVKFPDSELYLMADMPLEALNGFDIVLSGYWEIPDGTTPAQARTAHEVEADAMLYEMAAHLSQAGAATDIRLEFGPGEQEREHQQRLADELDADGILLADNLSSLLNILVLYHVVSEDTDIEAATEMLQAVEQTLLDRGFTEADMEVTVEVADDPKAAIAEFARNHHLVVMGETEQSDDQLFGPVCSYIAEQSETPVAVVKDR